MSHWTLHIKPVGHTPKEVRKELLGNRVREIRKTLGLTQEKFSEKLGVDPKTITRIENGEGVLSGEAALILYLEHGYSLDWIYGISETKKVEDQIYQVDIRDLIQLEGETVHISIKSRLYDDLKRHWPRPLKAVKEVDIDEEVERLHRGVSRQKRGCHFWNNTPKYYRVDISLKDFVLQEN